ARPERPSIRGGPATVPSTCYRIRVERPARHKQEPIHRTNGAWAGHPAAERWLLPTPLAPPPPAPPPPPLLPASCLPRPAPPASHQPRGGLGVPPRRRIHQQAPILLLGPFGPLAALQQTPQRNQQLAGQCHDAHLPRSLVPGTETPSVPLAERAARLPA